MGGLTSLPSRIGGQLGPVKSDGSYVNASEWNTAAQAIEEIAQSLGLGNGTTAGTIEAERVGNWPSTVFPTYGKLKRFASIEHFLQTTTGLTSYNGAATGTNAGVGSDTTSYDGRIGIAYVRTGDTNTGKAYFQSAVAAVRLGYGRFRYRADVRLSNLSDGTETFQAFSGLHDSSPDTTGVDSVGFRYTHSVNGGKWQFVTRANNVETTYDTGVTVAALNGSWYALEFEVAADGSQVLAYINGVLVVTATTNIPTGANVTGIMPAGIAKSAGTTSRAMYIDLAAWTFEPTVGV